jgi:branched-chain amino acid transport system permease protein
MLFVAAAAGIALLLVAPVLPAYSLFVLSYMLVFAIACLAFNLVFGTAGSLSLGHAAYFGAAAYGGAFLYRFSEVESLELYLAFGMFCSTALAAAIGFFCVRTSRIFFAILTFAFSMVVYSVVVDGAVFRLLGSLGWSLYLLGGGSMYLPRLTILGTSHDAEAFIPVFYNVIVAAFILSGILLWRITVSPFGLALKAIRDNTERALMIGIPVRRYRWYAFTLSGLFMGLAGALYGQLARQITVDQLHWLFSAQLIVATVLGGTRQFVGPVLGAFAFVALDEYSQRWVFGRNAVMGLLIIVVVFAFPRGIAGSFAGFADVVKRRLIASTGAEARRVDD